MDLNIRDAKLYKITEIMEITGRSCFKITYDIKNRSLKSIPHKDFEHYRVFGKDLKNYLGIE